MKKLSSSSDPIPKPATGAVALLGTTSNEIWPRRNRTTRFTSFAR